MQRNRIAIAVVLLVGQTTYGQQDVEKLIEKRDPAIQAQLQDLLNTLQSATGDPTSKLEICRKVQEVKQLSQDEDELVKQLAVFVVTAKGTEDNYGLILREILQQLELPPRIPIRVLAPYLDADNQQLRDSVRQWFKFHDAAHTVPPGAPPIKPVNYEDYLEYVEWKVTHTEEVPAPFITYIFEQSPGRALLVFTYANSHGDITTRLLAIRKSIEGAQPKSKEQRAEYDKGRKLATKESREARLRERSEIELAEHIVSNTIWLKGNEVADRFQAALPEANETLALLAKHKEWWTRLYVAYIMRQHPELRQGDIIQQLRQDANELVREAAANSKNRQEQ